MAEHCERCGGHSGEHRDSCGLTVEKYDIITAANMDDGFAGHDGRYSERSTDSMPTSDAYRRAYDWSHRILAAIGACITDQQNGYDVLASASWDRVCKLWEEKMAVEAKEIRQRLDELGIMQPVNDADLFKIKLPTLCQWLYDDTEEKFDTDCGRSFFRQHDFLFCPYCGERIE